MLYKATDRLETSAESSGIGRRTYSKTKLIAAKAPEEVKAELIDTYTVTVNIAVGMKETVKQVKINLDLNISKYYI